MAPEIFVVKNNIQMRTNGIQSYSKKCDIWSLGTVLYELLFGHSLARMINFKRDSAQIYQLENFLIQKSTIPFPKDHKLSKEAVDLLEHMLDKDPEYRYDIEQVLMHPWLRQKFEQESHKELLRSFYIVDDLQNGGEITPIFFSLKSRRLAICRIFLNEIIFEFSKIFGTVSELLQSVLKLESQFEAINFDECYGAKDLKALDWPGLFRCCYAKVVYLIDKVVSVDLMLNNKHNHMVSNFLLGNFENLRNYKIVMNIKRNLDLRIQNHAVSEYVLSKAGFEDLEPRPGAAQEEAKQNVFRGLLIWTEVVNLGLLLEYRSPMSGLHLVRPLLMNCFKILDYDISGINYKIEYLRPVKSEIGPEIYDIGYFLNELTHASELYLFNSKGAICNNRYAAQASGSQEEEKANQDLGKCRNTSKIFNEDKVDRDVAFKKKDSRKKDSCEGQTEIGCRENNVRGTKMNNAQGQRESSGSGKGFNVYRDFKPQNQTRNMRSSLENKKEDDREFENESRVNHKDDLSSYADLLDSKPFFEEDDQMYKLHNLFSIRVAVENESNFQDETMAKSFRQLRKMFEEYEFQDKYTEESQHESLFWSGEEGDSRTVIRVNQQKKASDKSERRKRFKDSNVSEFH